MPLVPDKWMIDTERFVAATMRAHRTAFRYVRLEAVGITIVTVLSALATFLYVGMSALLVDELVATSANHAPSGRLALYIALAIGALILPDALSIAREWFDRRFWLRFTSRLETLYVRAHLKIDVATHEDPKFLDVLGRAENRGIYPIINLLDTQYAFLTDLLTLLISTVILARENMSLLLILLVGAVPRLVVGLVYGGGSWTLYDNNSANLRRIRFLTSYPSETYRLMESHLLGLRDTLAEKLEALVNDFLGQQLGLERKRAFWSAIAVVVLTAAFATAFYFLIAGALRGTMSVGGFVFTTGALLRFVDPLQRIFMSIGRQYEFALIVYDIFTVMDTAPSVPFMKESKVVDRAHAPEIVFENVAFRYPGMENDVLNGVNFHIPSGSSFALVGVNGAGKTTLVKLLARFYDPTKGRILVDGVDLCELDLDSWYRTLGVLFQHFPIYESFSAAEGIAFGDASHTEDRAAVVRAAQVAEADDFIRGWEKGYDTTIGREYGTKGHGIDPSRGQEQRLALARMFYRDAQCLILDEPTAAVDAESEEQIFRAIENMEGKTRILISHRFSTVRNADQICVLDGGVVRELGSHAELMAKGGEYARLFQLQAAGYIEASKLRSANGEQGMQKPRKTNAKKRVTKKA